MTYFGLSMCSTGRYTPRRSGVTWNSSVAKPKVWEFVRSKWIVCMYCYTHQEAQDGYDEHKSVGREFAQARDVHTLTSSSLVFTVASKALGLTYLRVVSEPIAL